MSRPTVAFIETAISRTYDPKLKEQLRQRAAQVEAQYAAEVRQWAASQPAPEKSSSPVVWKQDTPTYTPWKWQVSDTQQRAWERAMSYSPHQASMGWNAYKW